MWELTWSFLVKTTIFCTVLLPKPDTGDADANDHVVPHCGIGEPRSDEWRFAARVRALRVTILKMGNSGSICDQVSAVAAEVSDKRLRGISTVVLGRLQRPVE